MTTDQFRSVYNPEQRALQTIGPPLKVIEENVSTSLAYIGTAPIGTATSAAAWTIIRETVSGDTTTIEYAQGGANTCVWDNRASLTYS